MFSKVNILTGIVLLLLATNLSTVYSYWQHQKRDLEKEEKRVMKNTVPGEQRTRFFNENLDLSEEQLNEFRTINRTFNREAKHITRELDTYRTELVTELGNINPDSVKLADLSRKIGEQHEYLKTSTVAFYLELKKICNEDQKLKLFALFKQMLKASEHVDLPQPGSGKRRGGRGINKKE